MGPTKIWHNSRIYIEIWSIYVQGLFRYLPFIWLCHYEAVYSADLCLFRLNANLHSPLDGHLPWVKLGVRLLVTLGDL